MEFQRELIVLFDRVQIRYYGIIIVVAMLVAATVAARVAKRDGRDPDHIWGALTWAIIPAIVGARLWFVLFPPASLVVQGMDTSWFIQNFFNLENGAIAIWSGGLSIVGAVLGGFLGAYIYMRRNKLPLAPWMDIAAVGLPVGQAIGRWANFVNQELYGVPTDLPWGITIDAAHRVAPFKSLVDYPLETGFHPLFLYESLWSLLFFIVLLNLFLRYRRRLREGDIFLVYLAQYAFIRFLLEGIRVEVTYIPGTQINLSQAFMVIVFVGALAGLAYRHRPGVVTTGRTPDPQTASEST
ncbi:MAG: prolipoprotein diacylglyceryl transferase [Anaerolineae bacterium]|nr:prolipoprotein diacylglyceryl transferase [Anaerolineae bacterium]